MMRAGFVLEKAPRRLPSSRFARIAIEGGLDTRAGLTSVAHLPLTLIGNDSGLRRFCHFQRTEVFFLTEIEVGLRSANMFGGRLAPSRGRSLLVLVGRAERGLPSIIVLRT